MAYVIPFQGILYHPETIRHPEDVVTLPFDVISEEAQDEYHTRSPYNMIRLILGKASDQDSQNNNPHTRAGVFFQTWLQDKVLIYDSRPAFYLTSVEFPHDGRLLQRYNLICRTRLVPFSEGIVLPHERTFSRVKAERLELTKQCKANFSPIFALYQDTDNILNTLKSATAILPPVMDFKDERSHHHKMWKITDPKVHSFITRSMESKKIFIADGHHRYETALQYKNWLSERVSGFSPEHPANFVMMALVSLDDPGMVILPAHRMLKDIPREKKDRFISECEDFFEITRFPFTQTDYKAVRTQFLNALKADASRNTIGVTYTHADCFYLLTPKPGVMETRYSNELASSLICIDVTVLTRLIFMDVLGFDHQRLDNDKLIGYSSIAEDAIQQVHSGKYDMTFILNPTQIEQVRDIAEAGLIMPRKATYFYPKVITGQVINPLFDPA